MTGEKPQPPPKRRWFVSLEVQSLHHPKWVAIGSSSRQGLDRRLRARGLYAELLMLADNEGHDGWIPAATLQREYGPRLASTQGYRDLEAPGGDPDEALIHTTPDGGVTIHDYLDYQRSSEHRRQRSQTARRNAQQRRGGAPPPSSAATPPSNVHELPTVKNPDSQWLDSEPAETLGDFPSTFVAKPDSEQHATLASQQPTSLDTDTGLMSINDFAKTGGLQGFGVRFRDSQQLATLDSEQHAKLDSNQLPETPVHAREERREVYTEPLSVEVGATGARPDDTRSETRPPAEPIDPTRARELQQQHTTREAHRWGHGYPDTGTMLRAKAAHALAEFVAQGGKPAADPDTAINQIASTLQQTGTTHIRRSELDHVIRDAFREAWWGKDRTPDHGALWRTSELWRARIAHHGGIRPPRRQPTPHEATILSRW